MAGMQLGKLLHQLRQVLQPGAQGVGTDTQLLDRYVRHGDEAAFAQIVERRGPLVLAVCRQVLGTCHDAEDAFQATFLVLARKAGSVRSGEALAGWLHRVAYHTALRVRALTAQRQEHERQAREMTAPDLVSAAEWRELRPVLHEEVQRLPGKFRDPVILCYLEGKTNEEAATELGWPLGTVKGRLAQARELLRARLTRRGLALSALLFAAEGSRALARDPVPHTLHQSTVWASLQFAQEAAATGAVPASIRTLAEGTINAMFYAKVKVGVLMLAALLVLATLAGGLIHALQDDATRAAASTNAALANLPAPAPPQDLYGDDLPPHALARLGTIRLRAAGQLAISPDGKTAASYGATRPVIVLWDADSGRKLREIDCRFVRHTAFSADSKKLAVCAGNELILYDVGSGNFDYRIQIGPKVGASFVALARDGSTALVASAGNRVALLFDLKTKKEIARIENLPERPDCFAAAPDNSRLVCWAPNQIVHAWDVRTGKPIWQRGKRGTPPALAFAPDGQSVLLADNDYKVVPAQPGKPSQIEMLRSDLWLLDAATGKELRRWKAPEEGLAYAACSGDGKTILAVGQDGQARLLAADTTKELRRFAARTSALSLTVCLSANGQRLAAVQGNMVHVWDVAAGKQLGVPEGHHDAVLALAFSRDGRFIVTGSRDRTLRAWDSRTGQEIGSFAGDHSLVRGLIFSPDDKYVVGHDAKGTANIWDFATRQLVASFKAQGWVRPAFSPDGRHLILADSTDVIVWDLQQHKEVSRHARPKAQGVFTLSADGALLALTSPGSKEVIVWDTAGRREVRRLPHDGSVNQLAFTHDRKWLAVAQHMTGTTHIWDIASGRELKVIRRPAGLVNDMVFAPDGRTLAWIDGNGLSTSHANVCEVITGQLRMRWLLHEAGSHCLAFAPDSQRLATALSDTTVMVWSVAGLSDARDDRLSSGELERLWQDLGGDAEPALRAMARLRNAGVALEVFQERIKPTPELDQARVDKLIADLGSSKLDVRERAAAELERLEDRAEPSLRKLLATKPTLELTQRAERLLELLDRPGPDSLRALRAIEVLEHLGTPKAKALLESLAKGAADTRRTRAAAAALERLKK